MKSSVLLAACLLLGAAQADDAALVAKYRATAPRGVRMEPGSAFILVLAGEQRLIADFGGGSNVSYRVSTAKNGVGSGHGSEMTPPGWHKVHSRYGRKAEIGQAFFSRQAIPGKILPESEWRSGEEDLVLSRIFWLEGLEDGVNRGKGVDSLERCTYIHGTNREDLLGKPASHGCIRMGNKDVVELFELLRPHKNVYVLIIA